MFRVLVIAPVYRDWESASLLCRELDAQCAGIEGAEVSVLFADDGSPDGLSGWNPPALTSLRRVDALLLRRNVGHQRAIAVALCHVAETQECDAVLVMDADGEDRPEDAARLIRAAMAQPSRIVFAERRKRLESAGFQAGYHAYRLLHRVLTGIPVRMGNFSIVPASALTRLTSMSELWNHYVGAVFRSKLPFDRLPTNRGRRLRGTSRMDLIGLVHHGLAGIATFQDVVATRILLTTVAGSALVLVALLVVVGIRFGTDLAIPGWATFSAGLLIVLFAQLVAAAFSLVFVLITSRTAATFLPFRDCPAFVDRRQELATRP